MLDKQSFTPSSPSYARSPPHHHRHRSRSPPPPLSSSFPLSPSPSSLLLPLLTAFFCFLVLSHGISFYYLLTRLEGMRIRLDMAEFQVGESDSFLASEVTWLRTRLEDLLEVYGLPAHNAHTHRQLRPQLDLEDRGGEAHQSSKGKWLGTQLGDDTSDSQLTTHGHTFLPPTHTHPHLLNTKPHPHLDLEDGRTGTHQGNYATQLGNTPGEASSDSQLPNPTHPILPTHPHTHTFPEHAHTHPHPHPLPRPPPTTPPNPGMRTKREATDGSYGLSRTTNGVAGGNGRSIVQLQDRETNRRSEADRSWLQLTSYARIPYNAIKEFCSGTYDSCPTGPPGPIGPPGQSGPFGPVGETGAKGDRGDRGLPGESGLTGPPGKPGRVGPRGYRGIKGQKGIMGESGSDSRDGPPGKPGLDGIPGRNGLDGIPGLDGLPGNNGTPGSDGVDGEHGIPGAKGDRGEKGSRGRRGITGPRGRKGEAGTPGTHGVPGISTWTVNNTEPTTLIIAPSIPGSTRKTPRQRRPIVIHEGDNLRLYCQATGVPSPLVVWARKDGRSINTGQWNDVQVVGPTLNLTLVDRSHMGVYVCQADNGVPPADEKEFPTEVHFEPHITVHQWKVGTYNTSTATLECQVQSFPVALTYWLDQHGRMIDSSPKYSISKLQHPSEEWKSTMQLTIHNIEGSDYGDYQCVAKNEIDENKGNIQVHEIDRTRYTPSTGTVEGITSGHGPPRFAGYEDLCPPPQECPDCPRCPESRGVLFGLRVEQFGNDTYPGFRNRTTDCMLSAVGKPVYHRHTNSKYGSWMRDTHPRDTQAETRYFTTLPTDTNHLYEYENKNLYRRNQDRRSYTLPSHFVGNSHVVYNGSFYYQEWNTSTIVRYDLTTHDVKMLTLPQAAMGGKEAFLYQESNDYIDLNVDDNGLWIIYSPPPHNTTVVTKIDPWTLMVEYSWLIHLNHKNYGHFFITCGVLYAIDSATERETRIRIALDLYRKKRLEVDLPFNNPFRKTTMLGYNYDTKEIYSWDNGNQLTYPVKDIDIGYNIVDTVEEE